MKAKLLTSLTALLALAGSASAADLGVRRPVYKAPVVRICTWCGFYAGVNAGGAWGREDISLVPTGLWAQDPNNTLLAAVGSPSNSKTSFTGGGQIGVNSQWLNFVVGLEQDIQYLGLNPSQNVAATGVPPIAGAAPTAFVFNSSIESRWLATTRLRMGYAFNNLLLYGTAGIAWGQQNYSQTYATTTVLPAVPANLTFNTAGVPSNNRITTGLAAGGGGEWKFAPNLSARLEYLYIDLSNSDDVLSALSPPLSAFSATSHSHVRASILRAGVNYQFAAF
jgi:outer membrane immunogenic protein